MRPAKVAKRKIVELLSIRNKANSPYFSKKEAQRFDDHRIPEIEPVPAKPHSVQQAETEGRLPFDQGHYHCQEYNDLMKNVKDIRHEYSISGDHETRKALATDEITHWHDYMQKREQMLPEKYDINEKMFHNLRDIFQRESERRTNLLTSERVLHYHSSYASEFKFSVPINSRNMIQMVHPFHGYLCNIEDKKFTFDEMIKVYRQQLVSSYEREIGQTYLADELA